MMQPSQPAYGRASGTGSFMLFVALLTSALALGAALAHAFELPNKMALTRDEYLLVQRIYTGWNRLAIVIGMQLVALLSTIILYRDERRVFWWSVASFVGIAFAQGVFWMYTFPANEATQNWATMPADWQSLRDQWEYSHLGGAVLQLIAFAALVIAVLSRRQGA